MICFMDTSQYTYLKNNSVKLSVVRKWSNLHFDFFKMFMDGCDIDGFCTKSEKSDWKDVWMCDKIHQYHSHPTVDQS